MAGAFTGVYKQFMNGHAEDVWVETGTYNGESVRRALGFGFREIHTIEVCQDTFNILPTHNPAAIDLRVHRYLGSSRDLLPSILARVCNRHVVFWLDAHYQGLSHADQDTVSECPLLDELRSVVGIIWQYSPVVGIDDTNMFSAEEWDRDPDRGMFRRSDWPTTPQILDVMQGWKHHADDNIYWFYQ